MPIPVECRFCSRVMLVANEVAGNRFRCPGCLEIIEAPPETTSMSTTERSTAIIRTEAKKNSAPPKRPAEDSLAVDSAGRPRPKTQGTREKKQDDATSQIWSVSSYHYPEVREPNKEKKELRICEPGTRRHLRSSTEW